MNKPKNPTTPGGYTLRDYFAAKAEGPGADSTPSVIAACLGWPDPTLSIHKEDTFQWFLWWRKAVAAWKYASADAMLAEREKNNEN